MPERIARKRREAGRVLLEVLEQLTKGSVLEAGGIDPRQHRRLAKLVKMVIALEDGKTGGQRFIEQVGFREPERVESFKGSKLRLQAQCLTQAQKVIGGVVETHEVSRDAAHAA
jgi:hypothetical protein